MIRATTPAQLHPSRFSQTPWSAWNPWPTCVLAHQTPALLPIASPDVHTQETAAFAPNAHLGDATRPATGAHYETLPPSSRGTPSRLIGASSAPPESTDPSPDPS